MDLSLTATIFDIRRYSVNDGPGIRTTVFLKGCPLRCDWCHNPEGQSVKFELMARPARCIRCGACQEVCPRDAISRSDNVVTIDRELCDRCGLCAENCYAGALELAGKKYTVTELVSELQRDIPFFEQSGGGVTFSGGEPLMQVGFLRAALQECHSLGLHTAVDTCGYTLWETIDTIRNETDLFLYDLKLMDPARHLDVTGVSNGRILTNLRSLSDLGHRIIVRIPVIPGINDDEENLLQSGSFLSGLPSLEYVELLPYHGSGSSKYASLDIAYELTGLKPPADQRMRAMVQRLEEFGLNVKYGGM